uniref:Uncharacterized protein n=1 Tax=Gloeothece verrucosa (strain PCC 7822) TaxID=497965 RepID=E0U6E9_GLOV7|nr:hypothetical protein [Gloeothece verrucosa]ADN13592.1 conserved hypothetical protein [Gloeothece verrucosa PCC 7822]
MVKLIGILVLVVYLGGIWKFSKGYSNTNFNRSLPTRLMLSLLWPVLLVMNPAFRQNFTKALKGRD